MNYSQKVTFMVLGLYRNARYLLDVREGVRRKYMRVPSRFFGIRDLAYLKTGIWDFKGKVEPDLGLQL